jgi:hypothetical protein
MSGCASMISRKAARTANWSSASSTRVLIGAAREATR